MTTFDLDRCMSEDGGKCVTRNGHSARIICADRKGTHPVCALLLCEDDTERTQMYSREGKSPNDDEFLSLRNLPRKLKCWVVMWCDPDGRQHGYACKTFEAGAAAQAAHLRSQGYRPVIVPVEAEEPSA